MGSSTGGWGQGGGGGGGGGGSSEGGYTPNPPISTNDGQDHSDPASSHAYGVREFVNLLVAALKFYGRHSTAINAVVPAPISAALGTLAAALPFIEALNEPGPD